MSWLLKSFNILPHDSTKKAEEKKGLNEKA